MVLRRYLKYLLSIATIICLNFIIIIYVTEFLNLTSLFSISDNTTSTNPTHLLLITPANSCRQFTVSDNHPFFEREYPQLNLPRRLSNLSYENNLHQLHSLRLIVIACARNIESYIDKYRSHIEPILDLFHSSSRILILESDSNDKTVEKLYQLSRTQVYAYAKMSKIYPNRTNRLAFCRNILLDKAHDLKADYIFVTDPDIFAVKISSFLSNFQYNINDWSVMTASTNGLYYDIWALRTLSNSVMNYDVWHRICELINPENNYCYQSATNLIIGIHQKHIPIEYGLIEVRSAFGGAGLYRAKSTYKCKYNGENSTCEHVPFHLCVREKNQARIFINSQFQID
ncbi:unnamed protein product [Adineta steineri]|uniref:Uncharacterized protein n=1 Tax=Adineta steineri TaxID=433720 RepID=A0A814AN70_9BILA|nr:unnamed protein product [Adineta steineri]CAF4047039.1 unnamed protein product [Adineta steineri]CAF4130210.1 unnamed protein product [Adineta steineri]